MSSYWSSPLALLELGHQLGWQCMFVHMCFLKPDPHSWRIWRAKHDCLLKIKTKLNERKGWAFLTWGCWMVNPQRQWWKGTTQQSYIPARLHSLLGLRVAALNFNHNRAVFHLHSTFHPKNSEDFVDVITFIFTLPTEKHVGASVIFLSQARKPRHVNSSSMSPDETER